MTQVLKFLQEGFLMPACLEKGAVPANIPYGSRFES